MVGQQPQHKEIWNKYLKHLDNNVQNKMVSCHKIQKKKKVTPPTNVTSMQTRCNFPWSVYPKNKVVATKVGCVLFQQEDGTAKMSWTGFIAT